MKAAARAMKRQQAQRPVLALVPAPAPHALLGRVPFAARVVALRYAQPRRLLRLQMANWSLNRRKLVQVSLRQHEALDAIATGHGTVRHAQVLAGAANIAVVLCNWGLGTEHEFAVVTAQRVIQELQRFVPRPKPGKQVDPLVPLGKPGVCPLDRLGLEAVAGLLLVHDAQREHADCTRGLMVRAEQEVLRRTYVDKNIVTASSPKPAGVKDASGKTVLKARMDGVGRMVTATLRRLRTLVQPEDGSELGLVIATLETYCSVAEAVMSQCPAQLVRQCAEMVADEAAKAAAQAEGVPV
jgi:hypothetical protein